MRNADSVIEICRQWRIAPFTAALLPPLHLGNYKTWLYG